MRIPTESLYLSIYLSLYVCVCVCVLQLPGHLPPKRMQIRRTRRPGYSWKGKDELINNVLQWTPTHERASVDRPPRTYIRSMPVV